MACGRPDHVVALAGEIVAPGTDPTGDPVLLPGHLEHAPPHEPEPPALREGDMRLALVCGLALLLACELDQVLEEAKADVLEGRQSSKAAGSGGTVHTGGAAGDQVTSAPLPRGTQSAYYHDPPSIGQENKRDGTQCVPGTVRRGTGHGLEAHLAHALPVLTQVSLGLAARDAAVVVRRPA